MLDGAFTRGTTPTHIFPIPAPLTAADLADFTIVYRQKNKNILTKYPSDICFLRDVDNEHNLTVILSQADTLMFNPKIKIVEVQIKAETVGSDVMVIGEYRLRLNDSFDTNEFDLE